MFEPGRPLPCPLRDQGAPEPRHFIVLADHVVYPEVERLVGAFDGYAIVEKEDAAGEVVEAFDASVEEGRAQNG